MFRGKQYGCLCFIRTAEAGSNRGGGGGGELLCSACLDKQVDTSWHMTRHDDVAKSVDLVSVSVDGWRVATPLTMCFPQINRVLVNKLFTKRRNICLQYIRISWTARIHIVLLYCGVYPPTTSSLCALRRATVFT